jgi:undecaprenyl-diphosphatase
MKLTTVALGVASVLLTVAVATGFGPVLAADTAVAGGLHSYAVQHPGVVRAMQTWTDVFQPWTFRVILIAVGVWLLVRNQLRLGLWTIGVVLLAGLVDSGVKALIGRTRPHWTDPVSHAVSASFPSGHALTSAMGCAVLVLLAWPTLRRGARRIVLGVGIAVPLITGFTRLGLGVHYLSDVVGGWLFAATIITGMALLRRRITRSTAQAE